MCKQLHFVTLRPRSAPTHVRGAGREGMRQRETVWPQAAIGGHSGTLKSTPCLAPREGAEGALAGWEGAARAEQSSCALLGCFFSAASEVLEGEVRNFFPECVGSLG